jgi:thioredoxin-like negative regulator of GroEL
VAISSAMRSAIQSASSRPLGYVPQARIVKANVDESPNLAMNYRVDSIPSLKVFKTGAVTAQQVGLVSKGQLRAMLSR